MFYIIVSDKIRLQVLTENDAEDFFSLMIKNQQHLRVFMPRIMETKTIDDTKNVIKIFLKQFAENNGFRVAIYYDTKLVGITGLKYIDWINKKTEIMYWIDHEYSGKGITTECVNKLIDIAFNNYQLNKIIIKSSIDNAASKRIAEKCGFTLEGVSRQDELISTEYTDICVYSLLKEEKERL